MTESASPMHYGAQGATPAAEVRCAWCGGAFTPKRGWARFCKDDCRNAFHKAEARTKAIQEAAPRMFEALQLIARGEGSPVAIATAAIHDLKKPETIPALTSLAATIAQVNADADRRDQVLGT